MVQIQEIDTGIRLFANLYRTLRPLQWGGGGVAENLITTKIHEINI